MARYLDARWAALWSAPTRRERRAGHYHPYLPDRLSDLRVDLAPPIAERCAQVETKVRRLGEHARFLLRAEATASSRIEGVQAAPWKVALAELSASEGHDTPARLVANNITVLRDAVTALSTIDRVSVDHICDLQRDLLPDDRLHGLRATQNWIGGSLWTPLDATFVPPPPAEVPALMDDLAAYLNTATHPPLVQAAIVHAQFETIHPFADGNGRIGRALIHTVLIRRGLTLAATLPISLALMTRTDEYIRGLAAFRYTSEPGTPAAREALDQWLDVFLAAADGAVEQAELFISKLSEQHTHWESRHREYRAAQDLHPEPHRDSDVARLLALLPKAPLLTVPSVLHLLGVTDPVAQAALHELAESGILTRRKVERNTVGYLARDVFDLLTLTERRLASTRWDTRLSAPSRPVPNRPQRVTG